VTNTAVDVNACHNCRLGSLFNDQQWTSTTTESYFISKHYNYKKRNKEEKIKYN